MEFRIIIVAEVPDSVVDMFGTDGVATALRSRITGDRPDFLPELITSYGFTVETPEGTEEEPEFAPAPRNTPTGRTGLTTAVVARDTRAVRVHSAPAPAPSPDGAPRVGRPPRIEGLIASDGGPVTEWGKRSVDNLKAQGLKVYRPKDGKAPVTAPESAPEPAPAPVRPVASAKGKTPVVKRRAQ